MKKLELNSAVWLFAVGAAWLVALGTAKADGAYYSRIVRLETNENPEVRITLAESITARGAPECSLRDYYVLEREHPMFAQLFSMLLAARLAERRVYIFSKPICSSDRPVVSAVAIPDEQL